MFSYSISIHFSAEKVDFALPSDVVIQDVLGCGDFAQVVRAVVMGKTCALKLGIL